MDRPRVTRWYLASAAVLIGAAFAIRLPGLHTGFTVDDYPQLAMMRGFFPVPRGALKLFTFSEGGLAENAQLRAAGVFPWWSHASLRVSLFRPLSSALMWFDLKVFGDNPFLYHLHSACWWLCMMALLAAVLRRLLPTWPALLALALCCAHSAHGMLLGWIPNRNASVASTFALLGLWTMLRAPASAAKCARWCALAAYALALCASEYAIGFLAYVVGYELQATHSWRQRVAKLVPWCGLLAVYLVVRTALGFGARGSGMYIDPVAESGAFLRGALVRLPILTGDLVLGIQANWWSAGFRWADAWAQLGLWPNEWARDLRPLQALQVAFGVVAILIAASLSLVLFRKRASDLCQRNRWLGLATPLALLPSLSSVPESRLLLPPLLGWSVIMASFAFDSVKGASLAGWRGHARTVALGALLLCQLAGPPYYVWPTVRDLPQLAQAARVSILAPQLDQWLNNRQLVLLASAADPTTSIYLPLVRRVHGRPAPRACHLLTSAAGTQRLDRLSQSSFAIQRLDLHQTPLDIYAAAFNREPLREGETFHADGMLVTVERALHGHPLRTRYELNMSLDDPGVVLLQQTLFGLRPTPFPAIGGSLLLDSPVPAFALIGNP